MTTDTQLDAAKLLIAAFYKRWPMITFYAELRRRGIDTRECPFLPSNGLWAKTQVMVLVSENWPRLGAWLEDRKNPIDGLRAAEQLVRLKPRYECPGGAVNGFERSQVNHTIKVADAASKSYWMSRTAFQRRSNWSVVK